MLDLASPGRERKNLCMKKLESLCPNVLWPGFCFNSIRIIKVIQVHSTFLLFFSRSCKLESLFAILHFSPLHLEDLKIGMTRHSNPTSTHVAVFCPLRLTLSSAQCPCPLLLVRSDTAATSLSLFTPRGAAPCRPCISSPPRCAALYIPLRAARRQRRLRGRAESRQS